MQASLLIPVQTEASVQQAWLQAGEKDPANTLSARSGESGPFHTHLGQHGGAELQQAPVEAELSTHGSRVHAADIAERGQDAPEEDQSIPLPGEQIGEINSEALSSKPNGSSPEQPGKSVLQPDSQSRQEASRVATSALHYEQSQSANGPVLAPAVKGPSVEVSPLSLGHSDDARLARDSGSVPAPVARPLSQQSERDPSVARAVDRPEKMVSSQARHSRAPAVHDLPRPQSAPEASTQGKKPGGSMRSLTQLLEAGSVRLEASSQHTLEPAVARARVVQQAIAQEQVANAAQAIRNGGPGQPTNSPAAMPDVRGAVLSEVLARSGETAQPGERATMIAARGLTALASQRGGSLAIRLDPPSLGEVSIRMNVIDGVVRADITAASSAARVLMEKSIDVLRCSLESRGLTVERLSIHGPIVASESHSLRSEAHQNQTQHQGGDREEGMNEDGRDAAGHQSRGRGGEQQDQSFDKNGESRRSRTTFKQVLDEDTT